MNILLVDDHAMFRESMELMISRFDDRFQVWQAGHGEQALEILNGQKMDLTLLDLGLPDIHGIELLEKIQAVQATPILILSASDSLHDMQQCMDLGARGYICKTAPAEHVQRAMTTVLDGRVHLPDALQKSGPRLCDEMEIINAITPRQREILELLQSGGRNKEIAKQLSLSEATVKVHVRTLFRTLGVNNRHSAVQKGLQLRLLKL